MSLSETRRRPSDASKYGVLVGTVRDGHEDAGKSPHYEIWVQGGGDYRIAVNVRSEDGSDVLALLDDAYAGTTVDLAGLASGEKGFRALATGAEGAGLDYLRDAGLVDVTAMVSIPPDGPGQTLAPDFDAVVGKAKADPDAVVIAFGEFYADKGSDRDFGFSPEQGIHDIHMNQGNAAPYERDNRVHGDGALFIRFGDGSVFAFFSRFTTQSLQTDPSSGNPVQAD